jgi:hypothetical protein
MHIIDRRADVRRWDQKSVAITWLCEIWRRHGGVENSSLLIYDALSISS